MNVAPWLGLSIFQVEKPEGQLRRLLVHSTESPAIRPEERTWEEELEEARDRQLGNWDLSGRRDLGPVRLLRRGVR